MAKITEDYMYISPPDASQHGCKTRLPIERPLTETGGGKLVVCLPRSEDLVVTISICLRGFDSAASGSVDRYIYVFIRLAAN